MRRPINRIASSSHLELAAPAPPPTPAAPLKPLNPLSFLRLNGDSTVINRGKPKSRPSLVFPTNVVVGAELASVTSASSSDTKRLSSGKFSTLQGQSQSTAQTSLDSKQSKQSGTTSQKSHSSGDKRNAKNGEPDELKTIQEGLSEVAEPVPSRLLIFDSNY